MNSADLQRDTPAHLAARAGNFELLSALIDAGAKLNLVNLRGYTAIVDAITSSKSAEMFQLIVKEKAITVDHTQRDSSGNSLLHAAARANSVVWANMLGPLTGHSPQNRDGKTPLHVAAVHDSHDIAVVLLDRGANPRTSANLQKLSPLHDAAAHGSLAVGRLLLDRGAVVDALDALGSTPLHSAVSKRSVEFVQLLCERGANIDRKHKFGK